MNFEINLFPFLLGMLFGALCGIFVAEHSRSRIWYWFHRLTKRKWPLVLGIIIVSLAFYFSKKFFSDWSDNILIGGVIGFAAAPWLWLHFSRDFLPFDEQINDDTANALRQEYFNRYQLLTIMLGVTLLFLFIGPQIIKMFKNANSVNIFGLSVSLPQQASGGLTGSALLSSSPASDGSALDKLTRNISFAASIYDGNEIPDTGKNTNDKTGPTHLQIFDGLSMWNCDQVIVAYFSRATTPRRMTMAAPKNLNEYVKQSSINLLEFAPDKYFLQQLSGLIVCLDTYAKELRDPTLFVLQIREFLEDYCVEIHNSIRRIGESGWSSRYDFSDL